MLRLRTRLAYVAALAVMGLGSGVIFAYVNYEPLGACLRGSLTDNLQKTVAALDGTIDLGLKLSTSIVGLGAAILIGLKSGPRLTGPIRAILLITILLFAQSSLYGIWWRLGIANGWLNECLNVVTSRSLQGRYQAHFAFFIFGLAAIGALVAVSAASKSDPLAAENRDAH